MDYWLKHIPARNSPHMVDEAHPLQMDQTSQHTTEQEKGQMLYIIVLPQVYLDGEVLLAFKKFKLLGMILDTQLTMKPHYDKLVK